MTTAAALIFAAMTAGIIAFQLALTLGAPWGAYAMGGAFPGRYPPAMRVAALVQAGLLAFIAAVVLSAAGVVLPSLAESFPWLIWGAVALMALGVVVNALSRSPGERRIWVPVTIVLLGASLIVALRPA
ncbi:MAG: hypothetical protein FJ038_13020 [Chloroflexi bacterium]|nr:hypothetical protein [Chloroflexota bacterium]